MSKFLLWKNEVTFIAVKDFYFNFVKKFKCILYKSHYRVNIFPIRSMLKLFCQLIYCLLPPLNLIPHLRLELTPCLMVCLFIMFQTVKVEPLYVLLRSIPKTFAHWLHPIVTFFSTTFSNTFHQGLSNKTAVDSNLTLHILQCSSSISPSILILLLVLPLKDLALASSVKLGIRVLFKTELLSVCASASSTSILL